jgi:hypothetical protein
LGAGIGLSRMSGGRRQCREVSANVDPAAAWLQEFLHAFAWFNHKTNYGYTFTLDVLPKPGTVRHAIEALFGDDLTELALAHVEKWPGFLRGYWGRWLFQFRDRAMDHLTDPRYAFSLFNDYLRGEMVDELMGWLTAAIRPSAVWAVRVETRGWYECDYADMAFEEPGRVLYLHAGSSD